MLIGSHRAIFICSSGRTLDGARASGQYVRVTPRPGLGRRVAARRPAHGIDDDAIRVLYEQHARALLTFVSRLVGGDRGHAEDIVQETLLRAWRSAEKLDFRSGRRLRPWLITVARRIAIDEYRSEGARPEEVYDIDMDGFSALDESERTVRSVTVMAALRELSRPYREILLHTYFYGRTVAQAADHLGLPLGTAKSRVYHGLRALRIRLEQQGLVE
jgi:RNA polymerase sigma-70 factor (ECF subfamily)